MKWTGVAIIATAVMGTVAVALGIIVFANMNALLAAVAVAEAES